MKPVLRILLYMMLPSILIAQNNKGNSYCDTIVLINNTIIIAQASNLKMDRITLEYCNEDKTIIISKDKIKTINGYTTSEQMEPTNTRIERKNSIFIAAGSLGLYFSGSINYESQIHKFDRGIINNLRLKIAIGKVTEYNGDSGFISLSSVILTGKRKNFLESNIGIARLYDLLQLSGGLGYRFMNRNFIFRIGMAFPEGANLGAGFRF